MPRANSSAPLISVVVPHYHDLVRLDRCLARLTAQTLPADRFEIIVADNLSPEGEAAVAQVVAGRARLVTAVERGAGLARNRGVAAAAGQILAFTDCDCEPDPRWLEAGVAALEGVDFAGGQMRVLVEMDERPTDAEAFEVVFAFDNEDYVKRLGFSVTANLFCRRDVFDAVGGFKVGVSEDLEWCHRARAAGFKLGYAPEAIVGHPARRTWDELVRKWRRINRETYGLSAGRSARRLRWLVRASLLPVSALAHAPRALFSPKLNSTRARLGAVVMLFRLRLWRMADAFRIAMAPDAA